MEERAILPTWDSFSTFPSLWCFSFQYPEAWKPSISEAETLAFNLPVRNTASLASIQKRYLRGISFMAIDDNQGQGGIGEDGLQRHPGLPGTASPNLPLSGVSASITRKPESHQTRTLGLAHFTLPLGKEHSQSSFHADMSSQKKHPLYSTRYLLCQVRSQIRMYAYELTDGASMCRTQTRKPELARLTLLLSKEHSHSSFHPETPS